MHRLCVCGGCQDSSRCVGLHALSVRSCIWGPTASKESAGQGFETLGRIYTVLRCMYTVLLQRNSTKETSTEIPSEFSPSDGGTSSLTATRVGSLNSFAGRVYVCSIYYIYIIYIIYMHFFCAISCIYVSCMYIYIHTLQQLHRRVGPHVGSLAPAGRQPDGAAVYLSLSQSVSVCVCLSVGSSSHWRSRASLARLSTPLAANRRGPGLRGAVCF